MPFLFQDPPLPNSITGGVSVLKVYVTTQVCLQSDHYTRDGLRIVDMFCM